MGKMPMQKASPGQDHFFDMASSEAIVGFLRLADGVTLFS